MIQRNEASAPESLWGTRFFCGERSTQEEAPPRLLRMPKYSISKIQPRRKPGHIHEMRYLSGRGRKSGEWINGKESFAVDLKLSHRVGLSGELRGVENGETSSTSFPTQIVELCEWNPS